MDSDGDTRRKTIQDKNKQTNKTEKSDKTKNKQTKLNKTRNKNKCMWDWKGATARRGGNTVYRKGKISKFTELNDSFLSWNFMFWRGEEIGVECLSTRRAPDPSGYGDTLYNMGQGVSFVTSKFSAAGLDPTVLYGVQGLGYHTVCVCGGGGTQ